MTIFFECLDMAQIMRKRKTKTQIKKKTEIVMHMSS